MQNEHNSISEERKEAKVDKTSKNTANFFNEKSIQTFSLKDELNKQFNNGIRQVFNSEEIRNWLLASGKLIHNKFSFKNAMLIWLQKPEATHLMGYEQWKECGRNVEQGARGAKIFIPITAYEKYKGGLYDAIKNTLKAQLLKNPSSEQESYHLGISSLEFTMNRENKRIGIKINGKQRNVFGSDQEGKRYMDRFVVDKAIVGYNVGTVFDIKDVIVPEYLWSRSGHEADEIAPDEKGNIVKNRRGEERIFNTTERQARFKAHLDRKIDLTDLKKMQKLFDACVAVSVKKGVPVILADKEIDSLLEEEKGYFSSDSSNENPNGKIVIDKDLEILEKCAALLHAISTAGLHINLDFLINPIVEDKIAQEIHKIQAEAIAFSVASNYGIETNTSSFKYLAEYANDFELTDVEKVLGVIYKEAQTLAKDIKEELDIMALQPDLTEKPKELLDKETLIALSEKGIRCAMEEGNKVHEALKELPSLIKQSENNPELMDILKYQKENLEIREADLSALLDCIELMNTTDSRDMQESMIDTIHCIVNRLNDYNKGFEGLSDMYIVIAGSQDKEDLKVNFSKDPQKTLELMKKDYPELAKLSSIQLEYIAKSKFIARQFAKLLRDKPQVFVDKVIERANLLQKVAAKNGTFVEVNSCEQWTDKPFFEKGTLCSPKIADKIFIECEKQVRGFRAEAKKKDGYYPSTGCDLTVFVPNKKEGLLRVNARPGIGSMQQDSLRDYLEKLCKRGPERKEVLASFTEALEERADKKKLIVQDLSLKSNKTNEKKSMSGYMKLKERSKQISNVKEKDKVVKKQTKKDLEKS